MSKFQDKLYFYNSHLFFFNNLLKIKKLPNSIIISGNEGVGKKTFLSHFLVKTQAGSNEFVNKENCSFLNKDNLEALNKIFQGNSPNIRIIEKTDKNKEITIEQIREIITYTGKSSLNGKSKFIGIVNIENLNSNSSNALLKILEKPPEKTFFFLLRNTENSINKTILSRCFKYNIRFSNDENDKTFKNLLNDYNLNDFDNFKIFNQFDTAGSKIQRIQYLRNNSIEEKNLLHIINFCLNNYKKKKDIVCLNYGVTFSKKLFLDNFQYNFQKFNIVYNKFFNHVQNSIKYNSDIDPALNLLKKVI